MKLHHRKKTTHLKCEAYTDEVKRNTDRKLRQMESSIEQNGRGH